MATFSTLLLFVVTSTSAPIHVVRGNVVLDSAVYLSILDLAPQRRVSRSYGPRAAGTIQKFLQGAGYDLATVTASVSDGALYMTIDEGRLEKIILPGQSGLSALAFSVMLDLPHKVFNRLRLEREIVRIREEYGLSVDHYAVVDTGAPEPPTVPILASFTADWVEPQARHRLEVHLERETLPTGTTLHLGYESPDGLQIGVGYRARGPFSERGRIEVMPTVGLRIQDTFGSAQGRRFNSRAELALRWYTAPLFESDAIRLVVEPHASIINRQRLDLNITSYDQVVVDPSVMFSWNPNGAVELYGGAGVSFQRVLGVNSTDTPLIRLEPTNEVQPFLRVGGELEIGAAAAGDTWLHEIEGDITYLFSPRRRMALIDLKYQCSLRLGWDLLNFELAGTSALGDVPYTRERSIGRFLRGVYGDFHYTDLGAGLGVEYQISIARDLYRFGVFHEGTVFRYTDPTTGSVKAAAANSVGIGVNALGFDMFQFGVYFAVGFNTVGDMDRGISLSITQVF